MCAGVHSLVPNWIMVRLAMCVSWHTRRVFMSSWQFCACDWHANLQEIWSFHVDIFVTTKVALNIVWYFPIYVRLIRTTCCILIQSGTNTNTKSKYKIILIVTELVVDRILSIISSHWADLALNGVSTLENRHMVNPSPRIGRIWKLFIPFNYLCLFSFRSRFDCSLMNMSQ